MRTTIGRSFGFRVWVLLPLLAMLPSAAKAGTCGQVLLKDASGVIGMAHGYTFSAVCSWSYSESKDSFSLSGFSSTSTNYGIDMEVVGKGKWDRTTGKAQEQVSVKGYGAVKGPGGSFTGVRVATGTCSQDPFLKDPPGGYGSCTGMNVQYQSKSGPIFNVLIEPKSFLLAKKISLVEAQALSGKKSSSAPPPPPAPKPQPKKSPTAKIGDTPSAQGAVKMMPPPVVPPPERKLSSPSRPPATTVPVRLVLEGEGFVKAGRSQAAGGNISVQPMGAFGGGWSGGAQLFWSGGSTGAVLDLKVDIPQAGNYSVELYLTRAPDYANLKLEVDRHPSTVTFNGYSPQVTPAGPMQGGRFVLQRGTRNVSFMIVGKDRLSKGYFAGIDRIVLTRIGDP